MDEAFCFPMSFKDSCILRHRTKAISALLTLSKKGQGISTNKGMRLYTNRLKPQNNMKEQNDPPKEEKERKEGERVTALLDID